MYVKPEEKHKKRFNCINFSLYIQIAIFVQSQENVARLHGCETMAFQNSVAEETGPLRFYVRTDLAGKI